MFDLNKYGIKDGDTISKNIIKKDLFDKIDNEIKYIKVHARVDKIKLTNQILECVFGYAFKVINLSFMIIK
jgi:hypothetical protein